jgi:hypothetical protein
MNRTPRMAPVILAGFLAAAGLGAQQTPVAMLRRANIVFVGTVTRTGATALASVAPAARMLVVRVEAVLAKPAALRLAAGDSITVEAQDSSWRGGERATFYTTGWVFGHGVAVREVGHETMPAQQSLAVRRDSFQLLQRQVSDSTLAARVRAADMIVVGRVEAIQAPTMMGQPRRRVTEHDPDWQEAVIVVDSMLKGPSSARVVVRFPGSLDVAWHRLPKFTAGQAGTFLLSRDTLSGAPRAILAGRAVTAYTAPTGADVLAAADAARIRALLKP